MSIGNIVYDLEERLVQPGCPICQVYQHSAHRYVERLLCEFVNDSTARDAFLLSWGYCPVHTRLVAKVEQEMFGDWLATNILFESLSRHVRNKLPNPVRLYGESQFIWKRISSMLVRGLDLDPSVISSARCGICESAESSAQYALSALIEGMENQPDKWCPLYKQSDGLCLTHLREALIPHNKQSSTAVNFILERRLEQLDQQTIAMEEYARKFSWDRRQEEKTEEELHAWETNLAFFSGYPSSSFTSLNGDLDDHE